MSHRIPVFYLPVPPEAIGDQSLARAEAFLGEMFGEPCVRSSTSANWWHVKLALAIGETLGIQALACLAEPLVWLSPDRAGNLAGGIRAALEHLWNCGLPEVEGDFGPELDSMQSADLAYEVSAASVSLEVDDDDGDVESFVAFLESLRATAAEACEDGRFVLFFQPQP